MGGLAPALIQGPLSRFGDTAANTGMLALLDSFDMTENLPVGVKTIAASVAAAAFRIFLMPVDTFKTTMQVEGKDGISKLMTKFKSNGPSVFYQGALAAASATFVGHYPWFFTYNYLSETLPKTDDPLGKLGRSAVIGFCSSAVSDTCSNSIRVVKVIIIIIIMNIIIIVIVIIFIITIAITIIITAIIIVRFTS